MNSKQEKNINSIMEYVKRTKVETLSFNAFTTYFKRERHSSPNMQDMFDYLNSVFDEKINSLCTNDWVFNQFVFDYDNNKLYAELGNGNTATLKLLWGDK